MLILIILIPFAIYQHLYMLGIAIDRDNLRMYKQIDLPAHPNFKAAFLTLPCLAPLVAHNWLSPLGWEYNCLVSFTLTQLLWPLIVPQQIAFWHPSGVADIMFTKIYLILIRKIAALLILSFLAFLAWLSHRMSPFFIKVDSLFPIPWVMLFWALFYGSMRIVSIRASYEIPRLATFEQNSEYAAPQQRRDIELQSSRVKKTALRFTIASIFSLSLLIPYINQIGAVSKLTAENWHKYIGGVLASLALTYIIKFIGRVKE